MLDRKDFARVFEVGEIIQSGAGMNRKNAAHLRITAIEEGLIRYQSINSKRSSWNSYEYLSPLIENFEKIDSRSIEHSVNTVLKSAGIPSDHTTENYAYTLAKAYLERTQHAFFTSAGEDIVLDQSLDENDEFWEGVRIKILAERIERSEKARRECIREHKAICNVCSFDFEKVYGALGEGFIHVHHHTLQLSETAGEYRLEPKKDLIPVCPNCHAMIHRRKPMLSIDELRKMLQSH